MTTTTGTHTLNDMQNETATKPVIVKLSNDGAVLADKVTDVRGYQVVGNDGNDIGKVHDLLLDEHEGKVHFLEVKTGGFLGMGRDDLLIPIATIEGIDRAEERIRLNQTEDAIKGAPDYHLDDVNDQPYYQSVYQHYGLQPFWSQGYVYPPFPHI